VTLEVFSINGRVKINIKTEEIENSVRNLLLRQIEDGKSNLLDIYFSYSELKLWDNWMIYVIANNSSSKAEELIWESLKHNLYNDKIVVYNVYNSIRHCEDLQNKSVAIHKDDNWIATHPTDARNDEDVDDIISTASKYSQYDKSNLPLIKNKLNSKNVLPIGSSVVDFAFNISEDVGLQAISCKINGVIRSLFSELRNGDMVELMTSPNSRPDSSWLNYVITFKAASYLTNYFKNKYTINKDVKKVVFLPSYRKIRITSIKNNNLLPSITAIIGSDRISNMRFASDMNNFIIAITTNIESTSCTNSIFLDLIKVNGVKKVDME
jgi:(p)ppGpp synthase/HD superfamily hydrolase